MATTLAAGDIAIVGYDATNPDDFAFVVLRDVEAGTAISFTDNGWSSSANAFRTGEGVGWHDSFKEHQNSGRKTTWQVGVPVVPRERPSGFVAAASIADVASMVTNWGDRGIEQINTDITLTLARAPQGVEIGLEAADRVSPDGIAVGTATVFDRAGRLGSAVVTSVSNAKRAVDLTGGDPAEDPRMQRGV